MSRQKKSEGWQLEGSGPEAYERYLVPMMFAPWAEELVERVSLRLGERVLDVGCGTGIVARRAASWVGTNGRVVGLDINESMLAFARSTFSDTNPKIEWKRGDATEIPLSDCEFDAVFCQQALQFIQYKPAAIAEIYRILVADGRVAASVWRPIEHNPAYWVMVNALEKHVGDDVAEIMRSPFSKWGMNDIRSFFQDGGFRGVHINIGIGTMRYPSPEEFLRREAASSPLADPLAELSVEAREALIRDIGEYLRAYADDHGLIFPMQTYIVTARK